MSVTPFKGKRRNMKKKTKLDNLSQTHGKIEKYECKTLDQILGDDGTSKYKTLDLEKYKEYLYDLNKSDLQSHASKIGLLPIDNRELLSKRLIKEFEKYTSSYKLPKLEAREIKLDKKARDVLAEGR
jgi:hypothetical protein